MCYKPLFIFFLIIFNSHLSIAQIRYEVTIDTTRNHCSVLEIRDNDKKFAVHEFSNCTKVEFFDNNNLLVIWDQYKDCHIRNISRGFASKDEPVFIADIKAIVSISESTSKNNYSKNGRAVNEYLYDIKYINKRGGICEMKVDGNWFMIFSNSCQ